MLFASVERTVPTERSTATIDPSAIPIQSFTILVWRASYYSPAPFSFSQK
jgi:hypothetical protein